MPTINPSLVPTISAGNLFTRLTTDDTLNVRYYGPQDPVYFEVLNRPHVDVVLRQLIIAKAVGTLELSLGHHLIYPFLTQPQVSSGSDLADLPANWIWDLQMSLPKKWQNLRLAKVKRMSGTNGTTEDYTGKLRLIFTATQIASATEVAIFSADYDLNSTLTYQTMRLTVVTSGEESVPINGGEAETVSGFITFRTLSLDDLIVQSFLDLVEPPTDVTDDNDDGLYDNPAIYELADSAAGGPAVTDDFSHTAISHGTGLLVDSAWNPIPQLDSDIQSWLVSLNYPFDVDANRTSTGGITIPAGLFREFDVAVPAGDAPADDATGTVYPVWISRIERIDTGSDHLRVFLATYNVTDSATGGTPSTETVEFASMDLYRSYTAGEIVAIVPIEDLLLQTGTDAEWEQHFGRGHAVLSAMWDKVTSEVDDFFDVFAGIVDSPADTEFTRTGTRLSSFGLSRVPKYIPTIGQSRALLGSTSRRTTAVPPSHDNRYVTEQDQGLGNQVDLEAENNIDPHAAVERYGYSGALCHRLVKLIVDPTKTGSSPTFYDDEILPRLTKLLGRAPQFGDMWYQGTRFMTYNGDTWIG